MRCPFCGNTETQVKDSRPAEDHVAIRRRRSCPACGGRFTTYERVQLRDLVVIKKNGKREDFDRDIGEIVMESLSRIDTVAYVRFASVYKNFQEVTDFETFVSELRPPAPTKEG